MLASRQRHNTCANVCIAEGKLREGAENMFGAFATKDLPQNYYVCAWTGVRVVDDNEEMNTYEIPVNFFDLQAYGMSASNEDGSKVYICPPLNDDGKPLFSVHNGIPYIEPGSSEQGLAIFLNEPSPEEHAVLDDAVIHRRRGGKRANVCMRVHHVDGKAIPLLFTNRKIKRGEELTVLYESDTKNGAYDRHHYEFTEDNRVVSHAAYVVDSKSKMICNRPENIPPFLKFIASDFGIKKKSTPRTFLSKHASGERPSHRSALFRRFKYTSSEHPEWLPTQYKIVK